MHVIAKNYKQGEEGGSDMGGDFRSDNQEKIFDEAIFDQRHRQCNAH